MDTVNLNHLNAQLFIDGEWTEAESGRTMDVVNPATGGVIGALAAATAGDVGRAVGGGRWGAVGSVVRPHRLNDAISPRV